MTQDPAGPDAGPVSPERGGQPAGYDPAAFDPAEFGSPGQAGPAGAAAGLSRRVAAATGALLQTVASITDEQAREPSLLPGWTRGHVLTHLARNAESLENLLIWARTGAETPQYASLEAREQGVQDGAGRPAAELRADVEATAAAFAAQTANLGTADWGTEVRGMGGNAHPGWYSLWRRLTEVEVHHVDLLAGYGPDDWPRDFAVQCLSRVTTDFGRNGSPAATLQSSDDDRAYRIGPAGTDGGPQVNGTTRRLLAWLTGRSPGTGLTCLPAGPLPDLPSW
jgi:maleylpyruvate isomerase